MSGTATEPPERSALRLVAEAVAARPTFAGPERTPADLATNRPEWLLSLLVRFPALRARVRGETVRSPPCGGDSDEAEALCRLLLHPDPGVSAAAAVLVDPLFAPVAPEATAQDSNQGNGQGGYSASPTKAESARTGAATRSGVNHAKRVKWLERDLAEQKKKTGRLTRKLLDAEQERDGERDTVRAERARADELADELGAVSQQLEFALGDRTDARVLAERLAEVWEAAEPGRAETDRAGRDPRLRDHDVSAEGESRTRFRSAAQRAGIPVEGFLAALRGLAVPETVREPAAPGPVLRIGAVRELRVTQLGGGTEIGGSCVLVEAGSTRILVDAGLRADQTRGDSARPPGLGDLDGRPIDAVVVTHAHNDHGGYVPALLAERGPFPVVSTRETAELLPTMWRDVAQLNGRAATARAGHGDNGANALYGLDDVAAARQHRVKLPYGVERTVGDLTVELFPAGHILGAAGVVVRAGAKRAVITGDISGFAQETVAGYALPDSARGADLLVMESTCCGMDLGPRESGVERLLDTVRRTCEQGGRVLIPALSLGRAQELAGILRRGLPEVPVRVDGMAARLALQFERATAGGPAPLSIFGDNVSRIEPSQRAREIASPRGGVVISPSGSLAGGPVVEWARAILPDPASAVLISGHSDEEAPGRQLERLRDGDDRRFTLHGTRGPEEITVRAQVVGTKLSAHADRSGLLEIVREVDAARVHLVHGVPFRQKDFGRVLTGQGRRWALGHEGTPVVL